MSRGYLAGSLVIAGVAGAVIAGGSAPSALVQLPPGPAAEPRSSVWLSRLPDGEAKRKFILDCTGCHQFDEKIARPQGTPRTEAQWAEAVTRMLGYAGATTTFPVIAFDRDARRPRRGWRRASPRATSPTSRSRHRGRRTSRNT